MTLEELNALPADQAAEAFRACCGSSKWVERMVQRRPFASSSRLREVADDVCNELSPDDWREAFSHHPRIGEQNAAAGQSGRAAGWSSREQEGMQIAAQAVRAELAEVNTEYARRFGHIYIVCAAGRSGEDLLTMARERLLNDPATELRVASNEQRQITQLRLKKLLEKAA